MDPVNEDLVPLAGEKAVPFKLRLWAVVELDWTVQLAVVVSSKF